MASNYGRGRDEEARRAPKCEVCRGTGLVKKKSREAVRKLVVVTCPYCQGTGFEGGREP